MIIIPIVNIIIIISIKSMIKIDSCNNDAVINHNTIFKDNDRILVGNKKKVRERLTVKKK